MISFRQLLVIALVIGVLWLLSQARGRLRAAAAGRQAKRQTPVAEFEDTVRCRHCGTYLLRNAAKGNDKDGYYCPDPECRAARPNPR